MRSSKSRSRNKGNRNRSMGNIVNRVFDSSGPEGKVRGTPQQIIDKYNQLARDAQLSNDRVATENFQQHAEHYLRLLAEAQREQQERQQAQQASQQGGQQQDSRPNGDARDADEGSEGQQQQTRGRKQDDGRRRNGGGEGGRDQAASDSGDSLRFEGGDVIDTGSDEGGLVETPENKPRRSRSRKKAQPADDQDAAAESAESAD